MIIYVITNASISIPKKNKGEWWNVDPESVISQALQTGGGPNVSDAFTINGLPGPLYNCSAKGIKFYIYGTFFNGTFFFQCYNFKKVYLEYQLNKVIDFV